MKRKQWLALLAALLLLAGCGGKDDAVQPPEDPAPVQTDPVTDPAPSQPEEQKTETSQPEDTKPEDTEDTQPAETQPEESQPEDAKPEDVKPEDTQPAEDAQPAEIQPEEPQLAEPEPAENQPQDSAPEDGTYTVSVALEGGTGRATVESPATLRCEGGKFYAAIVWSSPNFDYMKVNGEKYLQTNTEGNSTFEIPVLAFDQKLDVIADTVAMSEPHEVEYTLYFDSSTLQKQ